MLEKTARRWLRVIHICFISSLTGGLLSILAVNQMGTFAPMELYIANFSIYTIFNTIVTYSFYGVIATGLVYSLFTHWGLTKHWWIIGKWVGTFFLFLLVWISLGPAINGMVALSEIGLENLNGGIAYGDYQITLVPAILFALIVIAILISITIFRPWGQRVQKYEMRRGLVLSLAGIAVSFGLVLGIIGYLDLESYRNMEIHSPDLSRIPDGKYKAEVEYAGFTYAVRVDVSDHMILGIQVLENRTSPYAQFAEGVINRILVKQTPDVEGITGATTTSKCLMKTVETALEGAIQ